MRPAQVVNPYWQTLWNSDYLSNPELEQYSVKVDNELIALAEHYVQDFGAVALPSIASSAPRFLIADDAAKRIFFRYLQ